jgi:hypothetical protein
MRYELTDDERVAIKSMLSPRPHVGNPLDHSLANAFILACEAHPFS